MIIRDGSIIVDKKRTRKRNISKIRALSLCIFCLALLFLAGCNGQSKEDSLSNDEILAFIQTNIEQQNINVFTCSNCGEVSIICDCHKELGYPSDYCCECARKNFKICTICRKACAIDETQTIDGLVFCLDCMKNHGEDNPYYLNGDLYYFSDDQS